MKSLKKICLDYVIKHPKNIHTLPRELRYNINKRLYNRYIKDNPLEILDAFHYLNIKIYNPFLVNYHLNAIFGKCNEDVDEYFNRIKKIILINDKKYMIIIKNHLIKIKHYTVLKFEYICYGYKRLRNLDALLDNVWLINHFRPKLPNIINILGLECPMELTSSKQIREYNIKNPRLETKARIENKYISPVMRALK